MFEALKAALSDDKPLPCQWDSYREFTPAEQAVFLPAKYNTATFIGNENGLLYKRMQSLGIDFQTEADLVIVEAESATETQLASLEKVRKRGGLIWLLFAGKTGNPALNALIPTHWTLTDRKATALEANKSTDWGKYFDLPHLYFAETEGDKHIMKYGLGGEIVETAETVLTASRTDWSLFNQQPENKKCAQIVLYEQLQKPSGVALLQMPLDKATLVISTLDYRIENETAAKFWKSLLSAMQIRQTEQSTKNNGKSGKKHDLLLDGPVN
jgi:beta-galactosidase